MRVALTDQNDPMTAGFIGSIIFHIFIVLAIIFGVPSFFEPEILPEPIGIEAAIISDITAAPKVQKPSNKKLEKPKEQPAPETPKPKAETPPPPAATPATPPPPPPPEKQAVAIPDPTKKPTEKKPEEKPKKPEKKPDDAFANMMKNLTANAPAPEPTEKPKKKAAQPPAEPTSGPQTEEFSAVPLTSGEEEGIRAAIEQRWNVPLGLANIETYVVMIRVYLNRSGVVTKTEIVDGSSDPGFRTVADSAVRAIKMTQQQLGHLPIPPDKYNSSIILRWNMATVCQQMGC